MGALARVSIALIAAVAVVGVLPAAPPAPAGDAPPQIISQSVDTAVDGERVLELPIEASHVTLTWLDDHEDAGDGADTPGDDAGDEDWQPDLWIAFSLDGVSFGPDAEVIHDDAAEHEAGRARSGVMWTGGARFVRLTAAQPIEQLTVVAIQSPPSIAAKGGPAVARAAVDHPQVIRRADWAADDSYRYREVDGEMVVKWPPMFFPTQKLIVHHTAGINNDPDPAATIRAIYYNQAMQRIDTDGTAGWGDIGYNFLIDEAGRIYEGRYSRDYGPDEIPAGDDGAGGGGVQGAHVGGYNSGTIGIALLGHLVNQDATPAARAALEWLLAFLAERHGVDPLGEGTYTNPHPESTTPPKDNPNISGHRDWSATACPGGTFYANMAQLRQAVADLIAAGGSPAIPPPAPPPPQPGPPDPPPGLTATAHDNFVIKLAWQASAGGTTPLRYRVFRNGVAIGSQQTALTFTDQRKKANTFTYQVRAIDAAGRKSALSAPVTVSSVRSAGDGTTPPSDPTVPQGLTATAHDNFVIQLSWQASTSSATGAIRYRVFRNGKAIGTKQTALTFTDQRKKANTFTYQVRAIDAAGRKSALSPPITVSSVRVAGSP